MSYSKNRAIALAITEGAMTTRQAALRFDISERQVRRILAKYRLGGLEALEPGSRRPRTNPHQTPPEIVTQILTIRTQLERDGLDSGPDSILTRLTSPHPPSRATVWRILKREGHITPQPQKRPRSSWHRFEAARPNEMWQSDFTHYPLANGTDIEIITWLDDHSRYVTHVSAHNRITTPIVIQTFTTSARLHGLPASTLTDNGLVYTTRLSRGNNSKNNQPNAFENLLRELHIKQKNSRPSHPTTQGKIERYHQTLKKWLNAQPPAHDLTELNKLLADFATVYNTIRPHRALANHTPAEIYNATEKAGPTINLLDHDWRIRYDIVDKTGTITLRYAGKLRHLGIGRTYKNQPVIALNHGPNVMIILPGQGEIIAEFTINPNRDYQPKTSH